jgi:hypothetical protein
MASLAGAGSYFLLRQSVAGHSGKSAPAKQVASASGAFEAFSAPANFVRPRLEEIKTATGGSRLMLLVKWLPDAMAEEIRQLVAKEPGDDSVRGRRFTAAL